jgi:hypothetical protein
MDDDQDKVQHIGVAPRRMDIPASLVADHSPWNCAGGKFGHGPYIVSEAMAFVQCATCKAMLNPFFVLGELLHRQSNFMAMHERYQDEMRRLKERSRTKCRHCGEMTPISGR